MRCTNASGLLAMTIVALAGTALACGAGNSTAWPTCPNDTPCPKTGRYYYCQAGKAQNGCQLDKPFPSSDCCSQCVVPAPPAIPTCPTAVPCPMDGTNYYSCSSGKAVGGCRKASLGPFPAADCKRQCTFNSANPKYIPPACPTDTPANCPTDGRFFFYCKKTGECRPQSLGWIPNCSAKGDQCLLAPKPTCKCATTTPCPKDGQTYWYCQAGKAEFGCQKASKGPFPAADCTLQCRTA